MPRLRAAFDLLPGSAALALVQAGARPADTGLQRAVDAQIASLAAMPRAQTYLDMALLTLTLADTPLLPPGETVELVAAARSHVTAALHRSPAQARGWLTRAALDLAAGDRRAAAAALELSFVADPHLPALAAARWPMAVDLGNDLDRATRERASLEFLSFARRQPDAAVAIALRIDRLAQLRALASDDMRDRLRIDRAVERIRYDWAGA